MSLIPSFHSFPLVQSLTVRCITAQVHLDVEQRPESLPSGGAFSLLPRYKATGPLVILVDLCRLSDPGKILYNSMALVVVARVALR